MLDWTNIAENVISGVVTTAIVGVAVFIHGKTTAPHRKRCKKRPRKRR